MAKSTSSWQPPNYDVEIDFDVLAIRDADFAKIYDAADDKIDFRNPKAVQQVTKSLLKQDFGLKIELPDDRLCPPVPVRYNYIRWLQSLLDTTGSTPSDSPDPERSITGLDIGVGASCIYPLLASSRENYTLYGTDIDPHSLSSAQENVDINALSSRIHVRLSTPDSPLFPLKALGVEKLDFTMCNPPFYSSKEDMDSSELAKGKPPSAVCTGADVEMICEGGDVGFVLRMVEESLILREKVQWYTSMLGKLSSAYKVVDRLKEVGVGNWAVACLKGGTKTRRWVVGWSFGDRRPRNEVARSGDLPAALHPLPTAQTIYTLTLPTIPVTVEQLNTVLGALDLSWNFDESSSVGFGTAKENVWARAYRRKKDKKITPGGTATGKTASQGAVGGGKEDVQMNEAEAEKQETLVALGFRIEVLEEVLEVRWLRGHEYVLFESFCGMLKREMGKKG